MKNFLSALKITFKIAFQVFKCLRCVHLSNKKQYILTLKEIDKNDCK